MKYLFLIITLVLSKMVVYADDTNGIDIEKGFSTLLEKIQEATRQQILKPSSSPLAQLATLKNCGCMPAGKNSLRTYDKNLTDSKEYLRQALSKCMEIHGKKLPREKRALSPSCKHTQFNDSVIGDIFEQIDDNDEWNMCDKFCIGCCGLISLPVLLFLFTTISIKITG